MSGLCRGCRIHHAPFSCRRPARLRSHRWTACVALPADFEVNNYIADVEKGPFSVTAWSTFNIMQQNMNNLRSTNIWIAQSVTSDRFLTRNAPTHPRASSLPTPRETYCKSVTYMTNKGLSDPLPHLSYVCVACACDVCVI